MSRTAAIADAVEVARDLGFDPDLGNREALREAFSRAFIRLVDEGDMGRLALVIVGSAALLDPEGFEYCRAVSNDGDVPPHLIEELLIRWLEEQVEDE